MNWVKILEITLNNGVDLQTKERIGVETGNPVKFQSFDEVIETMDQTGRDLMSSYRETSRGGLAKIHRSAAKP